jgi:hypothetical protein
VAAAAGWREASGLVVGPLVISPETEGQQRPTLDDFIVEGLGTKPYIEGEVYYAIKVTVKDAANGNPLITPFYDGRSDVPGVKADAVGTHYVRFTVAAGGNFLSGDILAGTIIVTEGDEVKADNISKYFDISGLSQVYANTSRPVQIMTRYDYIGRLETSSIIYTGIEGTRYGPSSSAPSASGKYAVTFGVKGDGFKEASGLPAGTLTIDTADASRGTLTINDFVIVRDETNPWNTKYNLTKPVVISVSPKEDKKGDIGVITVKYLKEGESVPTAYPYVPKNVGYYAVTFEVAPSVKYNGITLSAGTLHINKADDPIDQFDMIARGIGSTTFDNEPKEVEIYVQTLGYTPPRNAVWYDGSNTPPIHAGTYAVTYDIILNDNWAGRSGIPAGDLIIQKASPSRTHYGNPVLPTMTYNGRPADVTLPGPASGVLGSNATKGFVFINEATGAKVVGAPTHAGTYQAYLTLGDDDDDWFATDGDGLLLPGHKLTINKRTAINADFELTAASKLSQQAYAITQPQFVRVVGRQPEYPTATTLRADFYVSAMPGGTLTPLTTVQGWKAQDIYVRINLAANLEDWNGGQLEWPFVINDNLFEDVDDFVDWYNKLRQGNTEYEAKFKTGYIDSPAKLKVITTAIKDVGDYVTAPNDKTTHPDYWPTGADDSVPAKYTTTNNANKRLLLNLTSAIPAALTTLAGAGNGFEGCVNLRELNLTGCGPATFPVDENTFKGLDNLRDLTLSVNTVTLGATDAVAIPVLSGLSALKTLKTGGVVTLKAEYLGATMLLDMLTAEKVTFTYSAGQAGNFEGSKIKGLTLGADAVLAQNAFMNSRSLASVIFPRTYSTKSIPIGAFKGCGALNSVTFPDQAWATSGSIASGAFEGCGLLQNVTIPITPPDGFDTNAFGGADAALQTLTLGQPVAEDTAAFAGKINLRTVNLNMTGGTVTGITASSDASAANKPGVFENCTRLSRVNFPTTGFVTIGTRAFKGCGQLVTDIPATVNVIGASAFEGCASIESITIPVTASSPLSRIFPKAFKGTGLKTLTIPQSITEINEEAFADCRYLTKVTLKNDTVTPSLTTLALLGETSSGTAGGSFAGCVLLDTFGIEGTDLPATGVCAIPAVTAFTARVDSFKDTAFNKVFIDSLAATSVNGDAFSVTAGGTSGITMLEVTGTPNAGLDFGATKAVQSINTIIWDQTAMATTVNTFSGTGATKLIVKKTLATAILGTFPNTLKTLEINTQPQTVDAALFNITGLTAVIIGTDGNGDAIAVGATSAPANNLFPATVKTITFTGKVGALGGKFSDNLTTGTGTNASPYLTFNFEGATGEIPSNATVLGDTGNKIQVVNLGAGVTEAHADVNFVSTSLMAINVIGNNPKYANANNDGVLYGLDSRGVRTSLIRYPAKKVLDVANKEYTIYSTVTNLEDSAFKGNQDIKILNIGTNVAYIGSTVFDGMTTSTLGLRTVNFNATRLSDDGLATDSVFPEDVNVVNIANNVTRIPASFAGTKITEIIIPENVVDMAEEAFDGCDLLESVRFYPKQLSLTSTKAFSGLDSIVNLVIGDDVTVIPEETFKGTMIVAPIILRSIVTIGASAFENCSQLIATLDIADTCRVIGNNAFKGATSLTGIIFRGDQVTIAANTSFEVKGGTGDELIDLYSAHKAGLYHWEKNNATNFGWFYTEL